MKKQAIPIEERFWQYVKKGSDSECWIWTGSKCGVNRSYGQISFNGRRVVAHRVSYIMAHGDIPRDLDVCHACDNTLCVNPAHLWLGTAHENILDMIHKGRSNYAAGKLTPEQVIEIRRLLAKGYQGKAVAKMFGVNTMTISTIKTRKSWKHLPQPDEVAGEQA